MHALSSELASSNPHPFPSSPPPPSLLLLLLAASSPLDLPLSSDASPVPCSLFTALLPPPGWPLGWAPLRRRWVAGLYLKVFSSLVVIRLASSLLEMLFSNSVDWIYRWFDLFFVRMFIWHCLDFVLLWSSSSGTHAHTHSEEVCRCFLRTKTCKKWCLLYSKIVAVFGSCRHMIFPVFKSSSVGTCHCWIVRFTGFSQVCNTLVNLVWMN